MARSFGLRGKGMGVKTFINTTPPHYSSLISSPLYTNIPFLRIAMHVLHHKAPSKTSDSLSAINKVQSKTLDSLSAIKTHITKAIRRTNKTGVKNYGT